MPYPYRSIALRISGGMLVVLGVLHLAVTPQIARFVESSVTAGAVDWLTPPMLLNHVVVGILLLPLGGLTIYAAPHAARGERWAILISRAVALSVATLPPTLFLLMGARYFDAVAFRVATGIVCAASATLLLAAFWPVSQAVRGRSRLAMESQAAKNLGDYHDQLADYEERLARGEVKWQ